MRSSPTEGKLKQLLRWIRVRYAVSKPDVMRRFGFEERQARRYIHRLEREGEIYPRYRNKYVYYSARRDDET